jgi:hypothetical protein
MMNTQAFSGNINGLTRAFVLVALAGVVAGAFASAPLAFATGSHYDDDDNADFGVPNFCADQVLIYAQDVHNVTPGPDDDTAIINDRNGVRLLTVSQGSNDDYIFWPQTTQVSVRAGEMLRYKAEDKKTPRLSFDILNASGAVLRSVVYTGTSGTENITTEGFIRFNTGEKAQEYNLLVLCRVQAPPPPPPAAPTADIKANGSDGPVAIDFNTAANLTWTSQNATSCTVTPGNFTGTSGSQTTGNLMASRMYTLTCTGAGGSATDTVTVNVNAAAQVSADIKANGSDGPVSISYNTSANLTWTSQNADSCVVTPGSFAGTSGSHATGNLTAAQTYTVTCTGQGGTATDTVTVNVSAQQITADIKANGSDSAISIAYNTAATLTWTSSGATSCTIQPGSISGTSGSQSTGNLTASTNYILTCTNGTNTATDSVAVNVAAQTQAPTVTISANPASITQGNTSIITWSSANATTCTAAGGWSGTKSLASNETVTPAVTTTYVILCTNDAGQSATAQTTVTVTQASQQVPTLTLYSTPTVINQGQSANLIWNSQNTTTCNATSNWSGTKSLNGSEIVYPSVTTTYNMQCLGTNGQTVTAQATVVVNSYQPPYYQPPTYYQPYQNPPSVTLYANPTTVNQGQPVTLNWYSNNATTCYASGANWSGTKSLTGSEIVYPTQGAVYTITCTGNYGSANDSENIYVIQTAVYYPPQVLGVADIVTGPEDIIPWALGMGLLMTIILQFTVLRPKHGVAGGSAVFMTPKVNQADMVVNPHRDDTTILARTRPRGYAHSTELQALLADIRERELKPDTE